MKEEPARFVGESPCQMANCTARVNLNRTHFCFIHRYHFALFATAITHYNPRRGTNPTHHISENEARLIVSYIQRGRTLRIWCMHKDLRAVWEHVLSICAGTFVASKLRAYAKFLGLSKSFQRVFISEVVSLTMRVETRVEF